MRSARRLGAALVLIVAASLGFTMLAQAQGFPDYKTNNEWKPTDAEVTQLPPYCQAEFRPQWTRARKATEYPCGGRFNHFCPGLVALNRAKNPLGSMQQRSFILGIAEKTLRGTREKMLPTCPLAPDVHAAEQRVKLLRLTVK